MAEHLSKEAVQSIRDELDEHLDAINSNTTEIQASFDYVAEVESKVDKLAEKIDRVLEMLEKSQQPAQVPLALREQEVFLALYTADEFLTHAEIAQRCDLPEGNVHACIESIIRKGVPILKRHESTSVRMQIDQEFRERQTRENVLQLNEFVMSSISTR